MAEEEKKKDIWPSGFPEAKSVNDFDFFMTGKEGEPLTKVPKSKLSEIVGVVGESMLTIQGGATAGTAVALPAGPTGYNRFFDASWGYWKYNNVVLKNPTGTDGIPQGNEGTLYWNGTNFTWIISKMQALPMPQGVPVLNPTGNGLPTEKATADYVEPAIVRIDGISTKVGNLFNKSAGSDETKFEVILLDKRIRTNDGVIITTLGYKTWKHKLKAGQATISVSGLVITSPSVRYAFYNGSTLVSFAQVTTSAIASLSIPVNADTFYLTLVQVGQSDTVMDAVMVNYGAPQSFVPFDPNSYQVPTLAYQGAPAIEANSSFIAANFTKKPKKNFFDKTSTALVLGKAYSPTAGSIGSNQNYKMIWLALESNKQYTVSGFQVGILSGGIFNSASATTGGTTISFLETTGEGRTFILTGDGSIKWVAINISATGQADQTYVNTFQLEAGDVATPYEPYQLISIFKGQTEDPTIPAPPTVSIPLPSPQYNLDLAMTRAALLLKTEDVNIVIVSTSLGTNDFRYTPLRADATSRPPLMDRYNWPSRVWDKLANLWTGQQYRRYDYAEINGSKYFTEVGTFNSTEGLVEWDDSGRRAAHTRYSDTANAAVSFNIPTDAWAFNFIYRSDLIGGNNTITVNEGENGLVEVWNGSAWVEANSSVYSMLEPPATLTKGNTTYQKRLKMRCKSGSINSIGVVKKVTIRNNGTGRFMYVGVEWSAKEHMAALINASRGSHQWNDPNTVELSQLKYQDNDIYGNNPKLLILEVSLVNAGTPLFTNIAPRNSDFYIDIYKRWIYDPNEPLSVFAKTSGFQDIDVVKWLDTTSILSGAYNLDGTPKVGFNKDGKAQTCIDHWDAVNNYLIEKGGNYINLYGHFKQYSEKVYGSIYNGMIGSGPSGGTLSSDGTHYNYNGSNLVFSILEDVFNFNRTN